MQEITNIAMGVAGSLLATTLGTFVNLSVPRIHVVALSDMPQALESLVGRDREVTAVRQSFQGYLRGEAIVIYGTDGCNDLGDLMGYDTELDGAAKLELLLDISNILAGACLGGIFKQIRTIASARYEAEDLSFSAPALLAEQTSVEALVKPGNLPWTHVLLLEVNFTLEDRGFAAHLCMLMPEQAIKKMQGVLDEFINSF